MSKSQCHSCAYKANIPGDTHISCHFDWSKSELKPPNFHIYGFKMGWYMFPLNFDPVWQIESCPAFSKERDNDLYIKKFDPLLELLSMLGR